MKYFSLIAILTLCACGTGTGAAPTPGTSNSTYHGNDLPQGTANTVYR